MSDVVGPGIRVVLVFALLALVLWVLKRTDGLGARRRGTPLQVVSTTRLAKTATLSVVRVHDEEYVLGVTGGAVTVVARRPAPAPAPAPVRTPRARRDAASEGPPSAAEFLRSGWRVLRKRPVEDTELSGAAVAAALATARGEDPAAVSPVAESTPVFAADLAAALSAVAPEPAPAPPALPAPPAVPAPPAPRDVPSPTAAEGSAAALPRRATRRPRIRTDAAAREERARWSPSSRPSARTSAGDSVAV